MSSSLLKTDSSFGTSQVSLSKTDHSNLREELGEINFVLDRRRFMLLCAEYLHLRNDKCQIDLLLVAAPLHSAGLRDTFLPACFRRTFFVVLQYFCGRNFYLTFTFFFFTFFFSCLFVFFLLLLLFVLSSGR